MKIFLLFFMLSAIPLAAQSELELYGLKPVPVKPRFDKMQWSLAAADFAVRELDACSTIRARELGYEEFILPDWIRNHDGRMYAYSTIVAGANMLLAHELVKHHHPRLAKLATAIDIGFDGEAGIQNMTLQRKRR